MSTMNIKLVVRDKIHRIKCKSNQGKSMKVSSTNGSVKYEIKKLTNYMSSYLDPIEYNILPK